MEIRSVADLMQSVRDATLPELDSSPVTHPPTIGDMYEGLTGSLLSRALPAASDLRIVSGFITDGHGGLSGQIDRMLVTGTGTSVPQTGDYICHVRDVVAVIEVKKTLNAKRLAEAYDQLLSVRKVQHSWRASETYDFPAHGLDMNLFEKTFSQTTGLATPSFDEAAGADPVTRLMHSLLLQEQISPLRVIIGYHGWGTETGFRRALYKFITSRVGQPGTGPGALPHLIACGNYSLVKANGHPYISPMRGSTWDFYVSMSGNPLLVLLEFLWTRLRQMGLIGDDAWGEDLTLENGKRFLSAVPGQDPKGGHGWTYSFWDLTPKELASASADREWQPYFLTEREFALLIEIQGGTTGPKEAVRAADDDAGTQTYPEAVQGLLDTALVAIDGDRLALTCPTVVATIGPNGEYLAADDAAGRFTKWLAQAQQGIRAPLAPSRPSE